MIHTARVMSQSHPWIAEELVFSRNMILDIPLVFGTPSLAMAAILSATAKLRWSVGRARSNLGERQ